MLESCSLGSTKRELVARVCGLEKFKDNDSGGISMIYVAFLSPSSLAAAHAHIMTGSGLAFTILQKKKIIRKRERRASPGFYILPSALHRQAFIFSHSFGFFSFSSPPQASQQRLQTAAALRQKNIAQIFFLFSLAFGVAESKANLSLFGDFVTVRALQPLKVLVASL